MSNKQSSIECLMIQLYEQGLLKDDGNKMDELLDQAREMHKQEIIKSATRGYLVMPERFNLEDANYYGIEYYNNCFGK